MPKRPYNQRLRAQQREETRERILAATVALHEELGPQATTISSIAARAGVQRLTVYRHFPDEDALFRACTSAWLDQNPPPDRAAWDGHPEPLQRAAAALAAFCAYYRSTAAMWAGAFRDEARVPAMQPPLAAFRGYLAEVADDLVRAWPDDVRGPCLTATARHLVDFSTWRSLAEGGLGDEAIAALGSRWLAACAARD